MKRILGLFVLIPILNASENVFPLGAADFSNEKDVKITDKKMDSDEMYENWKSSLNICWKDKRIVKCASEDKTVEKKDLTLSCRRFTGVMCPDANCKYE